MKRILTIFFCVAVVCGMSSCLNSDDNENEPTQEQMRAAMNELSGTYEGYMVYASNLTDIPDTVKNMQWTIDSVLTIKAFPLSVLAKSLSASADDTFKADVKALPGKDLKCYLGFYDVGEKGHTMNVIPLALEFGARTGDKARNCKVLFLSHNDKSVAIYQKSSKHFEFMMNTYGLYLDDVLQDNGLFNRTYFKFVSTSKH